MIFTLAQMRPAAAQGVVPVLRGRALQIVDESWKLRASIAVLPVTAQKNDEPSAETVLLRLITEKGRPSVKIGASEEGAGLALSALPTPGTPMFSSAQRGAFTDIEK